MQYRRSYIPGATYFFTVVTYQRQQILCVGNNPSLIKDAFKNIMDRHPFKIDAFVLLPDHLHCVWTLPKGDHNFSDRWMLIKSYFSRRCQKSPGEKNESRIKKREQHVWQRRFWEHQIRNEADFVNHIDYIHYNPVKHGLVSTPKDWPYSSFHRYVRHGLLPIDWGTNKEISFDVHVGNE